MASQSNPGNISTNRTTITGKQELHEKQLYGYLKRQTSEISRKKPRLWLQNRIYFSSNKNNAIRTYHIKAKIDNTQEKCKCRLCGDIDKVKRLATVVEDNQKAPFSIATTARCRGGRYSFPWIAPLYP